MMQTTTATTATVEAASNMGRFYPDRECLTRGIRRGVVAPMARRVTARNGHLRIKGLGGFGEIERGGPAAMGRPSASELTPRGWSYKVSATFRISDRDGCAPGQFVLVSASPEAGQPYGEPSGESTSREYCSRVRPQLPAIPSVPPEHRPSELLRLALS